MADDTSNPDVSVIVIAHKERDDVLTCLNSVPPVRRRSPSGDHPCGHSSTDGTARAVAEHFPDVEVVRLPRNEGVPARNHGLRRAHGRYRIFLDSDAQLTEGALPTFVAALEHSPRVGLVGPRLVYPDGTLQPAPGGTHLWPCPSSEGHRWTASSSKDRRFGGTSWPTTPTAAAGGWNTLIWYGPDDADWCFRIRQAGFDVLYVPEAEVVHVYRRSSKSRRCRSWRCGSWSLTSTSRASGGASAPLMAEGAEMDREVRAPGGTEGRYHRGT